MNRIVVATAAAALFAAPTMAMAADQPRQEVVDAISHMQLLKNTTATLPDSGGHLVLPQGYVGVIGADAKRLLDVVNGKSSDKAEAYIAMPPNGTAEGIFDYVSTGYITDDDWNSVDPAAFFRGASELTETQNKERLAEGLPAVHVRRWLQQPTYDQTTHSALWAIEATDSHGKDIVNATEIRLGREGFERLTLITSVHDYQLLGNTLDMTMRNFSFPPGEAYADHVSTDRAAGYGLAALVGALVGAKAVKIAAAGGLLVLLKVLGAKLAALLLLPLVFVKSIIRRFRGKAEVVRNDT